jgi:hypothetical protein
VKFLAVPFRQNMDLLVMAGVGGERRIFKFLESAPIKLLQVFENRKLPPLSFPEEFKKA